jgi:hypothetical protein
VNHSILTKRTVHNVTTGYGAETGLNRPKNSDKLSVRHDFYTDKRHVAASCTSTSPNTQRHNGQHSRWSKRFRGRPHRDTCCEIVMASTASISDGASRTWVSKRSKSPLDRHGRIPTARGRSAVSGETRSIMSSCCTSRIFAVCCNRTSHTITSGTRISHWRWIRQRRERFNHRSSDRSGSYPKSAVFTIITSG